VNRKWLGITLMVFVASAATAQENQKTQQQVLKTQREKISYAIGVNAARNLKRMGVDLDLEVLIKALRDVYSDNELLVTEAELRAILDSYKQELTKKAAEEAKNLAEKNKKEGEAFLATNKQKEGVVTLADGLQYKILKAGNGKKPVIHDKVRVNYRGTLIDGTEFDSSFKRGQPAVFAVGGVIPGWNEAMQLMPVGSNWQLFIPSELAYGARGVENLIGPNAVLIFEVELLAIEESAPKENAPDSKN
jgi:FKBP-type peptidyl-prolyl cis-trans isomerase